MISNEIASIDGGNSYDQQGAVVAPMVALSIVVPVYNGSRTIVRLVQSLSLLDIKDGLEIVLVDDGSVDNSAEVCQGLVKSVTNVPITFVKLARNFGEHNAVMAGLNYVRGAYIINVDDDLQNPPSEIEKLFAFARESGKHVVYTYYKEKKHSWYRNLGSKFANWTANIVLDKPKSLYLSSFRCMSAFVVREITHYKGPFPYIDGLIFQVTSSVGSICVNHIECENGRSNYNLKRLLRLWMSIALNFSTIPIRLSSIVGFIASGLSLLFFTKVIIEYFVTGVVVAGWSSLMAAILLLSGTQLIMLGIVGEYIGRAYQSISGKPQFSVERIFRQQAENIDNVENC